MVSLTIKMPPALKVQLEEEARLTGRSSSAIVREALLARKGAGASLFEQTQDLCGAGDSLVPDLATHPRHWDGFGA